MVASSDFYGYDELGNAVVYGYGINAIYFDPQNETIVFQFLAVSPPALYFQAEVPGYDGTFSGSDHFENLTLTSDEEITTDGNEYYISSTDGYYVASLIQLNFDNAVCDPLLNQLSIGGDINGTLILRCNSDASAAECDSRDNIPFPYSFTVDTITIPCLIAQQTISFTSTWNTTGCTGDSGGCYFNDLINFTLCIPELSNQEIFKVKWESFAICTDKSTDLINNCDVNPDSTKYIIAEDSSTCADSSTCTVGINGTGHCVTIETDLGTMSSDKWLAQATVEVIEDTFPIRRRLLTFIDNENVDFIDAKTTGIYLGQDTNESEIENEIKSAANIRMVKLYFIIISFIFFLRR
eukprot:366798_1